MVHSATKFIGGHGAVIRSVIVESGRFPWDNGKFAALTEPSPAYHGLRFWENFREYGWLSKAQVELLRDVGAAPPFNAFLLLLGLETLPLRMAAHVSNARRVAEHLQDHPAVAWVSYPIFGDSPRRLAEKYTPGGPGAVFTFGLTGGGFDAGVRFIEAVELASHLANVGDAKTLVIHPASTTHQQVPPESRARLGGERRHDPHLCGPRGPDDILWDLDRAQVTIDTADAAVGERLRILGTARTVALVGVSANPLRSSNFVATYLIRTITPSGRSTPPREVLGCAAIRLADLPEPPDIVDVFRRAEEIPSVVEEAIAVGAKVVWFQLGLRHEEAAARARGAGLAVVQDRCLKIEHARFAGGLHLGGFDTG